MLAPRPRASGALATWVSLPRLRTAGRTRRVSLSWGTAMVRQPAVAWQQCDATRPSGSRGGVGRGDLGWWRVLNDPRSACVTRGHEDAARPCVMRAHLPLPSHPHCYDPDYAFRLCRCYLGPLKPLCPFRAIALHLHSCGVYSSHCRSARAGNCLRHLLSLCDVFAPCAGLSLLRSGGLDRKVKPCATRAVCGNVLAAGLAVRVDCPWQ